MILASTALSALLLTAACGSGDDTASSSTSTSAPAADDTETSSNDSGSSSSYKAGDYEAEGSYQNPGGQSSVKVSLTLETDGTISSVDVSPEASGTSRQYQEKFVGGIADEVVGKSIDELNVGKVAGSSLTSGGFNAAVETIKDEAQA
ncbi:hypothetical protein ASD11_13825 [Aeromicrobium sp. Root495]|nr:hypothetical protein ASD11_13825 [Aeromicrobium sp. Root495]RYJ06519.1 MAG: hypothetical protein EON52_05950 [Actinomycetales bacterium]